MNTHILYLDLVILASAVYPSGLSYSLFTTFRGRPDHISTGLLATLVMPFAVVVPTVWFLRPNLLPLRGTTWPWLLAAVLLAPVALLVESLIHGVEIWRATGEFPRSVDVQSFWKRSLSIFDHLLMALLAVGEEAFFRLIWLSAMIVSGVPVPLALVISSVAYGFNHLFAGATTVVSKSVTGFLYGALYLAGGQSIILPIVSHVLQNLTLFGFTKERHA